MFKNGGLKYSKWQISRQSNLNSKWPMSRQTNLNIYSIKLITPINSINYILIRSTNLIRALNYA